LSSPYVVIENENQDHWSFVEGLDQVRVDKKEGYIDKTEAFVWESAN
jgi:hypothetical protein